MGISCHRDNYQMTDLIRDLIRFLRYNADYDLVDGLPGMWTIPRASETAPQTCRYRRLIENPQQKRTEGSGLKGLMNNLPAKTGG
jgi:hypothetical protein